MTTALAPAPAPASPDAPLLPELPATDLMQAVAVEVGACLRPVMQRLTDTTTGESRVVPIPCGATLASSCPPCAERNRKLRIQQCREGWHLSEDPIPPDDEDDDQADELTGQQPEQGGDQDDVDQDDPTRRVRSTRRRQDAPNLPRRDVEARSVGQVYETPDGKTYQPSTFLTVTMDSYGPVHSDGTPRDPASYDYRRAALDALHMPKLWDRFVQNLRRAAGYRVQYFGTVEPQRRLAPHIHAALRGSIPRMLIRQVLAGTYMQLWWPRHDDPVYAEPAALPVWVDDVDGGGRYIAPRTGELLPTWDEALDQLVADLHAAPAHMLRYGPQHKIVGLIAGPKADKMIGYLTKYLTKSIVDGAAPDGELSDRQREHARRLHDQVRWLPCSPECANWLRYGVTPKDAKPGMTPGQCRKRAHENERLGCGGRRVLVSKYWTGKTLTQHAADRLGAVRAVLEAADIELPAGCSATELTEDGKPRWVWEPLDPTTLGPGAYRQALSESVRQRVAWRNQYERARDSTGPPGIPIHSAIAVVVTSEGSARCG
jgi:hypothetical protein